MCFKCFIKIYSPLLCVSITQSGKTEVLLLFKNVAVGKAHTFDTSTSVLKRMEIA